MMAAMVTTRTNYQYQVQNGGLMMPKWRKRNADTASREVSVTLSEKRELESIFLNKVFATIDHLGGSCSLANGTCTMTPTPVLVMPQPQVSLRREDPDLTLNFKLPTRYSPITTPLIIPSTPLFTRPSQNSPIPFTATPITQQQWQLPCASPSRQVLRQVSPVLNDASQWRHNPNDPRLKLFYLPEYDYSEAQRVSVIIANADTNFDFKRYLEVWRNAPTYQLYNVNNSTRRRSSSRSSLLLPPVKSSSRTSFIGQIEDKLVLNKQQVPNKSSPRVQSKTPPPSPVIPQPITTRSSDLEKNINASYKRANEEQSNRISQLLQKMSEDLETSESNSSINKRRSKIKNSPLLNRIDEILPKSKSPIKPLYQNQTSETTNSLLVEGVIFPSDNVRQIVDELPQHARPPTPFKARTEDTSSNNESKSNSLILDVLIPAAVSKRASDHLDEPKHSPEDPFQSTGELPKVVMRTDSNKSKTSLDQEQPKEDIPVGKTGPQKRPPNADKKPRPFSSFLAKLTPKRKSKVPKKEAQQNHLLNIIHEIHESNENIHRQSHDPVDQKPHKSSIKSNNQKSDSKKPSRVKSFIHRLSRREGPRASPDNDMMTPDQERAANERFHVPPQAAKKRVTINEHIVIDVLSDSATTPNDETKVDMRTFDAVPDNATSFRRYSTLVKAKADEERAMDLQRKSQMQEHDNMNKKGITDYLPFQKKAKMSKSEDEARLNEFISGPSNLQKADSGDDVDDTEMVLRPITPPEKTKKMETPKKHARMSRILAAQYKKYISDRSDTEASDEDKRVTETHVHATRQNSDNKMNEFISKPIPMKVSRSDDDESDDDMVLRPRPPTPLKTRSISPRTHHAASTPAPALNDFISQPIPIQHDSDDSSMSEVPLKNEHVPFSTLSGLSPTNISWKKTKVTTPEPQTEAIPRDRLADKLNLLYATPRPVTEQPTAEEMAMHEVKMAPRGKKRTPLKGHSLLADVVVQNKVDDENRENRYVPSASDNDVFATTKAV